MTHTRLGCMAAVLLLLALPLHTVWAAEAPQMPAARRQDDSARSGESSSRVPPQSPAPPHSDGAVHTPQHQQQEVGATWQESMAQALLHMQQEDRRGDGEAEKGAAAAGNSGAASVDPHTPAPQELQALQLASQDEQQQQHVQHAHQKKQEQQQQPPAPAEDRPAEQRQLRSSTAVQEQGQGQLQPAVGQSQVPAQGQEQEQELDRPPLPLAAAASAAPASDPSIDFAAAAVLSPPEPDPAQQLAAAAAAEAARREAAEREARLQQAEAELTAAEDLVGWALDEGNVDVARGVAKLEALFARLDAMVDAALGESLNRRRPYPPLEPSAPVAEPDAETAGQGLDSTAAAGAAATDATADTGAAADASSLGNATQHQQAATAAAVAAAQQVPVPSTQGLDPALNPELAPLSDAAFTLAALLASGVASAHGVPRNDSRAVYVLHRAALAGSLEARLALADRYLAGRGVPRLPDEGLRHAKFVGPELLAQLDEQGAISSNEGGGALRLRWIDASYQPAGMGLDDANTLHFEQDLAARGDVEAHRQLGYRMLTGQGMERNLEGAFREFQQAAQGGDPYAQFNLGYMHIRGMHVPQNYTAALQQFLLAADKNLPAALNGLGVLYFHGQGVPVNYTKAMHYFAMAADRDHDAAYNLATMHQGGYGTPRNMSLAVELFQNATDLGSWRAPHQLFLVLADGLYGYPKNTSQAAATFWRFMGLTNGWRDGGKEAAERHAEGDLWGAAVRYALLAEQGNAVAMLNLAWLLHRGSCGHAAAASERHALALPLWLRAAARNHTEGMLLAGHAYRDGDRLGLPGGSNLTAAVALYQQAAAAGSIEGLFTLGRLREQGRGMARNTSEAVQLYRQAIRQAPHQAFAMAPFLALQWLRLRLQLAPLLRLLAGCLLDGSGAGGANRHGASSTQLQLQRRVPGLPVAAQWDTLLIAAMVGVLTWVLWRKRQLQQRSDPATARSAGAAAGAGTQPLQQQQPAAQSATSTAEATAAALQQRASQEEVAHATGQ